MEAFEHIFIVVTAMVCMRLAFLMYMQITIIISFSVYKCTGGVPWHRGEIDGMCIKSRTT
jgi:hypothetical protein